LKLLLDKRIGGPGQFDDRATNPNKFYLPLAGASCRVALAYRDKKIIAVEPGLAFDAAEWQKIATEIENAILAGLPKVGLLTALSGAAALIPEVLRQPHDRVGALSHHSLLSG
jgi:hypothetical protein